MVFGSEVGGLFVSLKFYEHESSVLRPFSIAPKKIQKIKTILIYLQNIRLAIALKIELCFFFKSKTICAQWRENHLIVPQFKGLCTLGTKQYLY